MSEKTKKNQWIEGSCEECGKLRLVSKGPHGDNERWLCMSCYLSENPETIQKIIELEKSKKVNKE